MSPCFLARPAVAAGRRAYSCPSVGGQARPLQQDLESELLRAAVLKQVNRSMQVDIDPPGKKSRPAVVIADAAKLLKAPGDHRFRGRPAVLELLYGHHSSALIPHLSFPKFPPTSAHLITRLVEVQARSELSQAEDLALAKPTDHDAARSWTDDLVMIRCQTCGRPFDERAYQIVVAELGSFESIDCAEKALRHHARHSGDELDMALLRAASHFQPQAVRPPYIAAFTERDEAHPA